jgi:hypothetical protein
VESSDSKCKGKAYFDSIQSECERTMAAELRKDR